MCTIEALLTMAPRDNKALKEQAHPLPAVGNGGMSLGKYFSRHLIPRAEPRTEETPTSLDRIVLTTGLRA